MALRIMDDMMTLELDNRVVATASVLRAWRSELAA
jgi:hypothetical protein